MPHSENRRKAKIKERQKTGAFVENHGSTKSVYVEFSRRNNRTAPKWHPVRKMRYVFFRMIAGCTITDALRELRWSPSEFWHLIDLKADTPFRAEYLRAKQLQGRALGDAVVTIAEGRDAITRAHTKRIDRLITKAMRRIARSRSKIKSRRILSYLMADLREHDKIMMTRNRLQIDAAKWLATKVNPAEFAEKSSIGLGGIPLGDGNGANAITIAFVAPDGSEVPFDPATEES